LDKVLDMTSYWKLEIAKSEAGLVLKSKPGKIKLDPLRIKDSYKRRFKTELADTLLNELIKASTLMETTKWTKKDFTRTLVVSDKTQEIEIRKIIEEWRITDKDEQKKYKNLLRDWAYIDGQNRPVNVLSRPALTADQNYGLILKDLHQGGLCCGGQINLYKYEDGEWKDLGAISSWKY
jgi:hypothetical protein